MSFPAVLPTKVNIKIDIIVNNVCVVWMLLVICQFRSLENVFEVFKGEVGRRKIILR